MQVNWSMIIGYSKYRSYILLQCFVIKFYFQTPEKRESEEWIEEPLQEIQ
jgi:hypothetical protein